MELLDKCPICEGTRFNEVFECKDYTVSRETFHVVKCETCDFTFTNPRPEINKIGKYYKSDDYISHSDTKKGLISTLYHTVRKGALQNKLNLINKLNKNTSGKMLDVGCGTGYFINTCKENKWNVTGVEVDDDTRSIAKQKVNNIHPYLNDIKDEGKYDIITMWHVLEHVHDLNGYLEKLKSLLKPSKYLVVAVPNLKSYDAQKYGKDWAAYDVPRHLYHFSQKDIKTLVEKHGMKLVDTKPMKYDSFYVSLMSEKHIKGSPNYLTSFLTGLKSNMKASSNMDYSSVIYIIQK